MTYCWKALNEGYNFAYDFISLKGLNTKFCAPKVAQVVTLGILGLPLGNPETKCHLDAGPMAMHRIYYKGKVVASPKSGS